MKYLHPTLWKHFTYCIYALALVCTLVFYQKTVITNPLSMTQQSDRANTLAEPTRMPNSPDKGKMALLIRILKYFG